MALYPARLKGKNISVLVGNGASPEVFTKICGATTRGITLQKNTSDDVLDPCDDVDSVPSRVLQVNSKQWDMALNITYNRSQAELLRSLYFSDTSSNFRFEFTEEDTTKAVQFGGGTIDAGYIAGAGQVTNLQLNGAGNSEYATGTMAIASDGDFAWVDAA